jgi:neutral amino acid transport system permease protein
VLRRVLGLLVPLSLLFGVFATAVAAQEGEGVRGTLTYADESGKRASAVGVEIEVLDGDGDVVATGTSDDAGRYDIDVPGQGTYVVQIVVDTLADGVAPRDAESGTRTIEVRSGERRGVLLPLVQGDGVASSGGGFFGALAQLTFDGIKFGMIIAMCAIGLSLIFGTTGLTNFAHGELVAFGALIALMLNDPDVFGLHIVPAAFVAVAATAAAGGLNERLLWQPLRRRGTGLIAMLVISIGLAILVRYIFVFQAGGRRERYGQYALQKGIDLGPITVVSRELWVIGISLVALVAVATAIKTTRIGKAMRAVADNRDLAESSGIDVERVIMTVWVVGGGLAGLGGVLFGLDQGVSWDMGSELLLLMFASVTLGGLGTAYGPLAGGLIIGLLVNVSTVRLAGVGLPTELKNVGALVVLIAILLVRPQGLLGQRERIG